MQDDCNCPPIGARTFFLTPRRAAAPDLGDFCVWCGQLVRWDFAEATLNAPSDQFGDATKLRKAGFEGQVSYEFTPTLH